MKLVKKMLAITFAFMMIVGMSTNVKAMEGSQTDTKGTITVSNVLVDTYTAIEIENPNKGYEKYPNASITLNGTTSNNTITTYIDNKRRYVDLSGYVWEDIRKW